MKKPRHIPIKISLLVIFIASLALPNHSANAQVNAQETGAGKDDIEEEYKEDKTYATELSLSPILVSYRNPDLWDNDENFEFIWREVISPSGLFFEEGASDNSKKISDTDALTRTNGYFRLGVGRIFNKHPAETSFFSALGTGYIYTIHTVQGVTAWQSSATDKQSYQKIKYERGGLYLQAEFGVKIKNRHKLSFYYIKPFLQEPSINGHTTNETNSYSAIPEKIIDDILGIRYSYILPFSIWRSIAS